MLKQMYFAASCTTEFGGNYIFKEKGYYYSDWIFFLSLKSTACMCCFHARGCHPKLHLVYFVEECIWCPGAVENIDHTLQTMKAFRAFSTPSILLAKSLWSSLSYNRHRRTFRSEIWANYIMKCKTHKDEGSACLLPLCKIQAVKPVLHTTA